MSAKPETSFIESVHRFLPPGRREPYHMKNNNMYTSGIWDVWYSGPRADLWVEYKFLPRVPVKEMFIPGLSELQKDWGEKRLTEGRNMAVIVGCKEGGVIYENLEWLVPTSRDEFMSMVWTRKEIAEWIIQRSSGKA